MTAPRTRIHRRNGAGWNVSVPDRATLPSWWRGWRSLHRGRGFAVLGHLVELAVLLAGVDPVLELDHAELGEAVAQPAVAGVEQSELLAVGHDLREQEGMEDRAVGRALHRRPC